METQVNAVLFDCGQTPLVHLSCWQRLLHLSDLLGGRVTLDAQLTSTRALTPTSHTPRQNFFLYPSLFRLR
jgi:hypothetical protein